MLNENLETLNEVDQLLTSPPSWIVRTGNSIFFIWLIIILLISWFVKYPDLLISEFTIKSTDNPSSVILKRDLRVKELFCSNKQLVEAGQTLAFFESTASHRDVILLDDQINKMISLLKQGENINKILEIDIPISYSLGEVQRPFELFYNDYNIAKSYISFGGLDFKKQSLKSKKVKIKEIKLNRLNYLKLLQEEVDVYNRDLESKKRLVGASLMTKDALDASKLNYIAKLRGLEDLKNSILSLTLDSLNKEEEGFDLEMEYKRIVNSLYLKLFTLKAELEVWKVNNIAIAPTSGIIDMIPNLGKNQTFRAGQSIINIIKTNSAYVGELLMEQYNIGKMKIGQSVVIKLKSYPFEEFGTLEGQITKIGQLPIDGKYPVTFQINNNSKTSSGRSVAIKLGMTGSAEIITEDIRLIEHFFYGLKRNLSRK